MTDALRLVRPLTPMQRRVAVCIAHGLTYQETAAELGIAKATVKQHVIAIAMKIMNPNGLPAKALVQQNFGDLRRSA